MASGTYVPSSSGTVNANKWLKEVWPAELDVLAYERAILYPKIKQFPSPGNKIHVPKFDNLSRTIIAETLAGSTGLTFIGNAETEMTASPGTSVVPVEITKSTLVRMAMDPKDEIREAVQMMLAQAIDSDVLALAAAFSTNVVGDYAVNVTGGVLREAHQKLSGGAKMYFEPGESGAICVLTNAQDDDLLAITEITQAQIRGDSKNPVVTGWVSRAYGVDFYESTTVNTSGANANNLMLIPRALGIGFNQKPTVISEDFQIWTRIMGWADFAYGTIRDQYAVLVKSPAV